MYTLKEMSKFNKKINFKIIYKLYESSGELSLYVVRKGTNKYQSVY